MRVPELHGVIRRRVLVNFRVDPSVMQASLPANMRPKLAHGAAIAGICLIRLEHVRPALLERVDVGLVSENAAHRVAVEWDEGPTRKEGVFIVRRDSDSWLNQLVGGRLFPGEHSAADFQVSDDGTRLDFAMRSRDGQVEVRFAGAATKALPAGSCFASVDDASAFFREGSAGYSVTHDPTRLDGLELVTDGWQVAPLELSQVHSSWFADEARFPKGSVQFDHALVMRDLRHHWKALPDFAVSK
jgi:uncharacterized protein YqjF (DUF2071 family)